MNAQGWPKLEHGVPERVRSDNGAEMTARRVKSWLASVGTKPLFIEPGSPRENGHWESFNGKQRDECLNGEVFYSLKEAQVVIEDSGGSSITRCGPTALWDGPPARPIRSKQHDTNTADAANRSSSDIPLSNCTKYRAGEKTYSIPR